MLPIAWANFGVTLSRSASWAGAGAASETVIASAAKAEFIDRFMVYSPSETHPKCALRDAEKRTKKPEK
jgi:hypothetical protein